MSQQRNHHSSLITEEEAVIDTWVMAYSLVLARVGSFVAFLPVLGGKQVPRLVKLGTTVALACVWFGSADTTAVRELLGRSPNALWWGYGLAAGREAALGAVLGYAFALFLVPVRIAGELIAEEMGFSMAS